MVDIIIDKIQIKRGLKANLPVLDIGEPALCTDTGEIAFGTSAGNIFVNSASAGTLVYNTLAELQAVYPNGTTQPVWIVADNAWYYWSGTFAPPADTAAPTLTITAGGTFTGTKTVTLGANETATIYYTLNGSEPTTASAVYSGPLSITATTTLKAFAKDTAGNTSATQTIVYTLDAVLPADTTPPANVSGLQITGQTVNSISLSWVAVSDAVSYDIYNGVTLLTNVTSTTYTATGLSASTQYTLTVKARDAAGNVASGSNVTGTTTAPADITAPILTITPTATFTTTQTVTMTANEAATIYYTLDDTDPKTSGTKLTYSGPLTLTATDTIKAYARDTAGNESMVQTVTYTKQATPTAYVSDTFTRADTTTGAVGVADTGQTWQNTGTNFRIVSNQLKNTGTATAEIRIETLHSDFIAKMNVIGVTGTTSQNTLVFRSVDANNALQLMADHGTNTVTLKLYKKVSGTLTLLQQSTAQSITAPYSIKVMANGSSITGYLNDVSLITATETTNQSATLCGISQWSGNGIVDDFWVGSLT